jgi:hypothetical protein
MESLLGTKYEDADKFTACMYAYMLSNELSVTCINI